MKLLIEHIKHLSEPVKHAIDAVAAGSSISLAIYTAGVLGSVFDKIINPILVGIGLMMTIVWTYHRIKLLKKRHDD